MHPLSNYGDRGDFIKTVIHFSFFFYVTRFVPICVALCVSVKCELFLCRDLEAVCGLQVSCVTARVSVWGVFVCVWGGCIVFVVGGMGRVYLWGCQQHMYVHVGSGSGHTTTSIYIHAMLSSVALGMRSYY